MLYPSKPQQELNAQLQQQGFDFAFPNPQLAWPIFKDFVQIPLPNCTIGQIGFNCFHVSDRDNMLWLEFALDIENNQGGQRIGCFFWREVPEKMRALNKGLWWSPSQQTAALEQGKKWDLATYFATVEEVAEFEICFALGDWNWA